jgi:hypothetical protein
MKRETEEQNVEAKDSIWDRRRTRIFKRKLRRDGEVAIKRLSNSIGEKRPSVKEDFSRLKNGIVSRE